MLTYKNKGDKGDHNMYMPLTMLSRLYTCMATVITARLDKVMGLLILPD